VAVGIISTPGAREIVAETLEWGNVPDYLRSLGYALEEIQGGERILPTAIREKFTRNPDGSLGAWTEDSTRHVVTIITHASIVAMKRFSFSMP
jgi:hypothetical protein